MFTLKYIVAFSALFFAKTFWYPKEDEHFESKLEVVQKLPENEYAVDAVFFVAADKIGHMVVAGCERRPNETIFGFFYILVPHLGLLYSPGLPQTKLRSSERTDVFGSTYFWFEPVEPMKKWKLEFKGDMKLRNSANMYEVSFEAVYTSLNNYFLLFRDINIKALSEAIAEERWSFQFLNNLRENQEIRYEQFGQLDGALQINQTTVPLMPMKAYRDRSVSAYRNWSILGHYMYLILFLENGQYIVVGVVSHSKTFSRLVIGFVTYEDGTNDSVEWTNITLAEISQGNLLPSVYNFEFKAGGMLYSVRTEKILFDTNYKGYDSEAHITENFLRHTVNDIPGYGICEQHYNTKQKMH